jgi:hypothetical protein
MSHADGVQWPVTHLQTTKLIAYVRRHYGIPSRLLQGRCWVPVSELKNNEVLTGKRDTHKNRPQVTEY